MYIYINIQYICAGPFCVTNRFDESCHLQQLGQIFETKEGKTQMFIIGY